MPTPEYKQANEKLQRYLAGIRLKGNMTATEMMHSLMEAAAICARNSSLDFETYVRLAMCAWDCSYDTETALETAAS